MTNPTAYEGRLIAQPDDRVTLTKALLLGVQHVMAMDVYVVPFIIASALALSQADSASLIQSTFLAAGIATIIQTAWCMRMPVAQGPSYIPLGAIIAVALAGGAGLTGMGSVYGALIPGALLVIALGALGWFHRLIRWLVPPIVGGSIILVVGLSLLPIALTANVFAVHGSSTINQNIALAALSAALLVLAMMIGLRFNNRVGVWVRLLSVVIALVGGTIAASFIGQFSFDAVAAAPWLMLPKMAFVDYELQFSLPAILTFVLIYMVVMAETTGTWFAVSAVIDQPITDRQLDRGAMGEGIGCGVAALIGATPVTGYSTNAGVISITGVASRMVFVAIGVVLAVLGFVGKFSALIAAIPAPVIGGVFAVVCITISMAGIRILRHVHLDERAMLVVGIPLICAFFATLAPKAWVQSLPDMLQYLLGSAVTVGAMAAMVMNLVLPRVGEESRQA
ncbi:uracil-xanthine permease family protein [Comamonas endophytica]|uniref:Purine/pyrimidine permease n=1 Tax=Comamonas endophytica TaxID=2949090 RepID=A0ABY6G9B4_9BURK|nr:MULTISPECIES: solute carrier family 23 protein [unclassified Acidovorax]MCD2514019.1 purine/pyrimidine permease [Acidovorax sp. D4N7]UYG51167.1 purine/pyrimidine permease [Acidovorax sp. 5MLIR]